MATTAGDSAAKRLGRLPLKTEPNWITGDLKYPGDKLKPRFPVPMVSRKRAKVKEQKIEDGMKEGPVQQSDLLKPLWMDIANSGLNFAYQKWDEKLDRPVKYSKTKKPKKVIIVGAGMAGLVAAYELEQVGHNVTVLESQTRVGGRVHTLGEKDGFAKDLHGEAGAMRLPCSKDAKNKIHFLTDFYAAERFKLPLASFDNFSENAYLKFYNEDRVQVKDWDPKNFDKLWPGWKKTLEDNGVQDVNTIDEYYRRTTEVLTNQLRFLLCQMEPCKAWEKWIDVWSQFPLDGFLQSSYEALMTKVKAKDTSGVPLDCLEQLKKYLPWPKAAITAYRVFTYTQQLDQSLVQYLREDLGQWWSPSMHCIQGGMSLLPEAFTKPNDQGWNKDVHLQKKIEFNRTVKEIVYTFEDTDTAKNHVVIKGYFTNSRQPFLLHGDAVIVTTPINILRQIRFLPSDDVTPPPPVGFQQAIEDIFTGAATKIFVQTKTRFWENDGIKGGFSKTNLPIGQIHYPSNCDGQHPGEKGILLIYTWKTEALLFGALDPTTAVHEAVEEIATIHPEIKDQVETGAVFAWYNQPTAQGAYALLKPNQYQNVKWLFDPMCNIFFAGEGLSFAAGWIQGALESGLRAAYQFYIRNEGGWSNPK